MNETWIHQKHTRNKTTIETRIEANTPKKAKIVPSAGKMITVFWDFLWCCIY